MTTPPPSASTLWHPAAGDPLEDMRRAAALLRASAAYPWTPGPLRFPWSLP